MKRETIVTILIIGISLLGAAVIDLLLPSEYPTTLIYAIPILLAAVRSSPRVVGVTGVLSIIFELVGNLFQNVAPTILPFSSISLMATTAVIVYLAGRLANQRQTITGLYDRADFERERWQTTVENMPYSVLLSDAEGKLIYMNQAYSMMTGRQLDPDIPLAERTKHYQLYRPDGTQIEPEALPLQRAVHQGLATQSFDIVQRSATGEDLTTVWNAAPLHDTSGRIIGAVAVGRDVTERRHLARERERLLAEAEHQRERMEETIHLIAHDIRQPLTIARGHVQLICRNLAQGNVVGAVTNANTLDVSTRRIEAMIEDLVESVRLESDQKGLEPQALDLEPFLREAIDRLPTKPNEVVVESRGDGPVRVSADPNKLERVVDNLVGNAVKYAGRDQRVTVRLDCREEGALISVADRGQGIDSQDLAHIFERGYRAKGSKKSEGLGLGLYISRLIVEAHGGRIWAESKPGDGSIFYFTLPYDRQPANESNT